jgi:hypothetical protein
VDNDVTRDVLKHFVEHKRIQPTIKDALGFIVTELAEVWELDLAREPYIRNHPEDKEPFTKERFAEELGDVVYMCIIAGSIEHVDVIDAMYKKMQDGLDR